ncbi:DUF6676 family protein [Corynebacterium tapiri]|uniref:1-deoxy-D-xylulose-5-phosphate synthase n=1 Tax=Corynebacterium tapiri TaxID=1448266 RepID=A0A5C4U5J3_9CORY|nr:DUF6676 family protein [Corynebacterium tapiri]TNL97589.1 hypothetical protein FHE74_05725 [Corynebacterium tapiri]
MSHLSDPTLVAEIAQQLDEDSVAFHNLPADPALEHGLREALIDDSGIVVVPEHAGSAPELRDLAQDVMNTSGLDTVIVRSPEAAAVVSASHSRAEIESAEWSLASNPDYIAGTRSLFTELDSPDFPFLVITVVVLLILAISAAIAAMQTRVKP